MGKRKFVVAAVVIAAAALVSVGSGSGPAVHQVVIPLHNASGDLVARRLGLVSQAGATRHEPLKIAGLDYLAVDTAHNAVLGVGTAQAVDALRQVIGLVDIRPRILVVDLRILHTAKQADGTLKTDLIASPTVKTPNDEEAVVSVVHNALRLSASARPRLNGDDTVSVTAELRAERGSSAGVYHRSMKRLAQGKSAVAAWLPEMFGGAKAWVLDVQPVAPAEQPGYYLEVAARAEVTND